MSKLCAQLTLALSLLISLGCQPRGEYDAMHRELFLKESKIYELQSDIEQYRRVLDSCRRANFALEAEIEGETDTTGLGGDRPPATTRDRDSQGRQPTPFLPEPAVPDVELPQDAETLPDVELPPGIEGIDPSGPPPLFEGTRLRPNPAVQTNPAKPSSSSVLTNPSVQKAIAASSDVNRIALSKLLTGGYNMDGHPGDEGILVVIEPRDGEDEIINAAGKVSIVLLDKQAEGDQQRFARWDFEAAEVQSHWRASPLGHGLHFELPWPAAPPTHIDMHVFVRLETADGRKLSADKPIKIELLDGAMSAGLQQMVDRGIEHITQPRNEPQEVDAPPVLHSVLTKDRVLTEGSVLAEGSGLGARPEPTSADPSAPTLAEPASATEPATAEPEVAEAEAPKPIRETQAKPEWKPFR